MKTVTIQIGNSDNKLSQQEWSNFCHELRKVTGPFQHDIFFGGGSMATEPWQNFCLVMNTQEDEIADLREALHLLARKFRQDSIAMTVGETTLVRSQSPLPRPEILTEIFGTKQKELIV